MGIFSNIINTYNAHHFAYQFDKIPTLPIIIFEILIISLALVSIAILSKYEKRVLLRFFVVALGIFIFEFFTSPMWHNYKMGAWAYIYHEISWILTVGWATLILSTIVFVDKVFARLQEWKRFGLYLGILTILVLILEVIVAKLGIRSYAPEIMQGTIGYLPFRVPIEALYYIPVFMMLVISFYKYWSFVIDKKPVIPIKRRKWYRGLFISFLGVFLFELMIDPMVVNANFPRWSYVYRDINLLLTGGWIIIAWIAINLVDKFFINSGLYKKFISYLLAIFIIVLPIESWLIIKGFRVYSASAQAAFSGFTIPIVNIPVEVAFAIPFYFALVVSFIKYWEIILDNKKIWTLKY